MSTRRVLPRAPSPPRSKSTQPDWRPNASPGRFQLPALAARRSSSTSSISILASAMSRSRRLASFSRHRFSSRRTSPGVAAGNAVQSGSRSRMAASVSVSVSPANARRPVEHLVEHAAERPDVGALVDGLAARLLGTHVRRRAEDHALRACRRSVTVGDCVRSGPTLVAGTPPSRARSRAPSRRRRA